MAVVALIVASVICGCGSEVVQTRSSASPSTITEAYDVAHPTGNLPETLSTVHATLAEIAGDLEPTVPSALPILLPGTLPCGVGLAAPFIAIGDGSALPNPETWEDGYRVAFTDGERLVIVAMNQDRLPGSGAWEETAAQVGGRPVQARRDTQTIVLATAPASDWRIAVLGIGYPLSWLETFADALRDYR